MGFLLWYLGMLDSRPITTKSISSALIYAAADITTQMITMEPYNAWGYNKDITDGWIWDDCFGSSAHMWFNFVARVLSKRDVITTFKKLLMGQLTYGPAITGAFFAFNAALQASKLNIPDSWQMPQVKVGLRLLPD